jgi:predicted phosphodiesterase
MKLLIIPDLQGRDFWIEPCSHIDEFDKIIFLGDYHDPYSWEVSQDTSRHRLRDKLVPFILDHQDKCICLFGNHDGNYLVGDMADRFDYWHKYEIRDYMQKMNIKLIYREGKYLFSHSGVLPAWLKINGFSLEDLENLPFDHQALMQVSPYRGGWSEAGSCIWGDVREYVMSEHIPDIYQIFGHTQLAEDPIIEKDWANLDCRKAFVLENDTIKEWKP